MIKLDEFLAEIEKYTYGVAGDKDVAKLIAIVKAQAEALHDVLNQSGVPAEFPLEDCHKIARTTIAKTERIAGEK